MRDFYWKRLVYVSYYLAYGYRKCIIFLSDLASAAKLQSLGRVGLMCLAECISSAACQVGKQNNDIDAQRFEDGVADMIQVGNSPHNDKIVLLDALRFIIESSKQHYNSNYRLRGLLLIWLDYDIPSFTSVYVHSNNYSLRVEHS